ncbi:uncharacterized protein LOC114323659 [Camellia sinensis]|uniref:uncharacterized protein LOC114323659 n=1 Tax=Camellia sinensis TaxID=4442 RepID=UPI0010368738|nr:uncharacterized protein LOC114323659 [Camellia sinensis]
MATSTHTKPWLLTPNSDYCVTSLGLEPEALEIAMSVASTLGGQTRVNLVCKSCELGISGSYLICDLRVMDMSDFDVIIGMDWLSVHRAIIDCYYENQKDPGLPHVVCEYADVFPDELPGLSPKRDIDLTIELQPGTSPISIAPYCMALAELRELKK